jgi:hypothetical protein
MQWLKSVTAASKVSPCPLWMNARFRQKRRHASCFGLSWRAVSLRRGQRFGGIKILRAAGVPTKWNRKVDHCIEVDLDAITEETPAVSAV